VSFMLSVDGSMAGSSRVFQAKRGDRNRTGYERWLLMELFELDVEGTGQYERRTLYSCLVNPNPLSRYTGYPRHGGNRTALSLRRIASGGAAYS
jgi:hypothetical protein